MLRPTIVTACLLTCCFALAACGGDDESTSLKRKSSSPAGTTATGTTPTVALDATTEPAPAAEPEDAPKAEPVGRTYSPTTAMNLTLSAAEKAELRKLAQAFAIEQPTKIFGASSAPITLQAARAGKSYKAGLGSAEYSAASYPMQTEGPLAQFLFKRTSKPQGPWKVAMASIASDVSFPCSLPMPLLQLWHHDFVTEGYCA